MIIDSLVYSSLHSNCHHQIIYAKFDLRFEDDVAYQACKLIISKGQFTSLVGNPL